MESELRIREQVRSAWGEDSPTERLLDALLERAENNSAAYLPVHALPTLVPGLSRSVLFEAAQWLSGPLVPVLELRFEYIRDGVDEEWTSEQARSAVEQGVYVDELGREDTEVKRHLFPFFVATPQLAEVARSVARTKGK